MNVLANVCGRGPPSSRLCVLTPRLPSELSAAAAACKIIHVENASDAALTSLRQPHLQLRVSPGEQYSHSPTTTSDNLSDITYGALDHSVLCSEVRIHLPF